MIDKYASAIIALLLGFALAGLFHVPAFPHGAAKWIQDGDVRSLSGQLCCGEEDCGYLSENAVHATKYGFEVHGIVTVESPSRGTFSYRVDEVVPYDEALPSPNQISWRCAWGPKPGETWGFGPGGPVPEPAEIAKKSERKCFFTPMPGS